MDKEHKFRPKKDITTSELAFLISLANIEYYGETWEQVPEKMRRHFQ